MREVGQFSSCCSFTCRRFSSVHWATGSSLTTPFREGCTGANDKASPPGRHQEQAPKQRCTFSPTTFSSVQFIFARCRLSRAAHGARLCLSVRTQPLTATGAPSQTSAVPCHAMFSSVQFSCNLPAAPTPGGRTTTARHTETRTSENSRAHSHVRRVR